MTLVSTTPSSIDQKASSSETNIALRSFLRAGTMGLATNHDYATYSQVL